MRKKGMHIWINQLTIRRLVCFSLQIFHEFLIFVNNTSPVRILQ
jgi:hypothetical protein